MITSEKMVEVIKASELNDDVLSYFSYSGRFMYGRTCLGFSSPISSLAPVCSEIMQAAGLLLNDDNLTEEEFEDICHQCSQLRIDNLGKNYVFYFPDLEATEQSLILGNEGSED